VHSQGHNCMIHKDVTRWCHADAHTAAGDGRAHNSTPGVPPAAVAVVAPPQTRLLLHVRESEPLAAPVKHSWSEKKHKRERETHTRAGQHNGSKSASQQWKRSAQQRKKTADSSENGNRRRHPRSKHTLPAACARTQPHWTHVLRTVVRSNEDVAKDPQRACSTQHRIHTGR
jgi:hypothetical protein